MHENQTQVLTYPTNLTLLPKTKCQEILNRSLHLSVDKEVKFLGKSCLSINNVESYKKVIYSQRKDKKILCASNPMD